MAGMNDRKEKIMKNFWYLTVCFCLCLTVFLLRGQTLAFDTGHHRDLCNSAMADEGFLYDSQAVKIVALQNWLVDYYSERPTTGNDDFKIIKAQLIYLHFDNLTSPELIGNYWTTLSNNMRRQVRLTAGEIKNAATEEERSKKILKMLTLLGASTHAVQDFYTHSDWAGYFPKTASYRSNTWFDTDPAMIPPKLKTGVYPNSNPVNGDTDHGDYLAGINKDSYSRPGFAEAYVFAYAASRQWIRAVKNWSDEIDPDVWHKVVNYSVSESDAKDLEKDLTASQRISEWIAVMGKDGAWKGKGSGSTADLAPFVLAWTTSHDSIFVDQFKQLHIHEGLTEGLDKPMPVKPEAAVPKFTMDRKTVEVRTIAVSAIDNPDGFLGKADYYAVIDIAGQEFVEAMQFGRNSVEPAWLSIKFVPLDSANIAVRYRLLDEDGGLSGKDDIADINPVKEKTALEFNFAPATLNLSGDVSGIHSDPASAVVSKGSGDKDRATVKFFVTSNPITN
jgi:hypothetical protein